MIQEAINASLNSTFLVTLLINLIHYNVYFQHFFILPPVQLVLFLALFSMAYSLDP